MISRDAVINAAIAGNGSEALSIARSYASLKQDVDSWSLLAALEANYGSFGGLEKALRNVLSLQPDNRDANYNLGIMLQGQKRSVEAMQHYRIALSGGPYPEAQANLGLLILEAGDAAGAISILESAVKLRPDLAEAQLNLGLAYIHVSRTREAELALSQAIAIDPRNGKALHSLGLCAEARGDNKSAEDYYRRAFEFAPHFIDSYVRLGRLLALRGETTFSRAVYEAALRQDPRSIEALLALGHLLSQMAANGGDYSESEACYNRALAVNPKDARIHYAFGWIAQNKGDAACAIKHYHSALGMSSDYPEAMAGLSSVLERQGKVDEARLAIAPALKSAAPHSLVLLADAALAKSDAQRRTAAERLAARAPLEENPHWRCDIYFAVGKLHDELGEYDQAFASFDAGNAIERQPFDAAANEIFFERITKAYSSKSMACMPRAASAASASELPVFIVGMPRSGTSLVEQILASHSKVFGAGELTAINYLMTHFDSLGGNGSHFPDGATNASVFALSEISKQHLAMLHKLGGDASRVTDKMPHNFICLGLLEQLFPRARIIHCLRDPIDTCLSIYFQHFNTHHPYANDLDALGRYYRQYERLMRHWRDVVSLPFMEIRYEELVADQAGASHKLLDFCGLQWDDACLKFFEAKRTVNTPSYNQVRQPIYAQSVARWKNYKRHIAPLLRALEA